MSRKKSKKQKKAQSGNSPKSSMESLLWNRDEGPVSRVWPPAEKRAQKIGELKSIPEEKRTADQNYLFGALSVYQGGIEDNSEQVAEGVRMLQLAADGEKSFPSAVRDLAWLSAFLYPRTLDLTYAEKATELFPEDPDSWKCSALALLFAGKKEGALESYKKACALEPQADAKNLSRFEEGKGVAAGAGYLFPVPDFGSLHYPPAVPEEKLLFNLYILKQCLANDSENQELLFEAAMHAFFLHRLEEAEDFISQLLDLDANHVDGLALLGYVCEKNNQQPGAVKQYRRVLELEAGHPFAAVNMARFYQITGSGFMAESLLKTALTSAPEYPEALSLYGRMLAQREGFEEKSLDYQRKAIQLEPENPEYHIHYCLSLLQMGLLDKLHGEWSFHKKYMQAYTDKGAVRQLLNSVLRGSKEPIQELAIAEMLNKNSFYRTARIFVRRAWKRRYTVDEQKQMEFFYYAGLQASHCEEHEVSLEAHRQLSGKGGAGESADSLIAISLNHLGRNEEALEVIQGCDMTDGRVMTVAASIQWSLGRYDEAVETYLRAAEKPGSQFLPFYHGMKYAMQRNVEGTLEKFIELGEKRWPESSQMFALISEALLVLEKPEQAIERLMEKLYSQGQPIVYNIDPDKGRSMEENLYEPYLVLGFAFLQAEREEDFKELMGWLKKTLLGNIGEWEMLEAERFRMKGEYAQALDSLTETNRIPAVQLTRALCYLSLEEWDKAENAASLLLTEKDFTRIAYHPAGGLKASAYAVMSAVQTSRGDLEKAEELAQLSQEMEPGNKLVTQISNAPHPPVGA